MKVKRSSWHYKLSNLLAEYESRNDSLCVYFWRMILKVGFILFLLVCLFALIYAYCINPFIISDSIMILFVILSFLLPAIVIIKIRMVYGKPPELPSENIVIEFIKAKKNKICPLIEYID